MDYIIVSFLAYLAGSLSMMVYFEYLIDTGELKRKRPFK